MSNFQEKKCYITLEWPLTMYHNVFVMFNINSSSYFQLFVPHPHGNMQLSRVGDYIMQSDIMLDVSAQCM